jgi:hypothetical protein
MADSSDHIAGKTGLTLTITASKAGAAFSSISPTVTELASGWYKLALTTSHTDTLGDLALHVTGTGADPTDLVMQVSARVNDDLAYPATSGRSTDIDSSGRVLLQPTQTGVTIPTVTTLTNAPSDSSGVTTLLSRLSSVRADYLDNLSAGAVALEASLQALITTIGVSAAGVASAVWGAVTRTLTAATNLSIPSASDNATAVRTELGTELGRIDAAVSSRSTYAGGDTSGTTTLLARLTDTRASNLDYLTIPTGDLLTLALGTVQLIETLQTSVDALPVPLDAVGTRDALGLAIANLDLVLAAIQSSADAAQVAAEAIPVGANGVEANIKAVNDVALTGVGTGENPWGPA